MPRNFHLPRRPPMVALLASALLVGACATQGAGDDWPARVVAADRMRPVSPIRVPIPTRDIQREVPGGTVMLRLGVGEDGRVRKVHIDQSSGNARLDASAARAVVGARFAPWREEGVAVAVTTVMPMRFQPSGRCLALGAFDC